LKGTRQDAILRIMELREEFHKQPLLNVPMTPILLPLTIISQSENLFLTSQRMANLRATDLAQLISLSSWSQPRRRCHADQYSFTTKPMPQDEDALTQMSGSVVQQGTREQEPPRVDNIDFHHLALSKMEHRAWWREKSLQNFEINEESGGRVD